MNYKAYQGSRDLAWRVLLNEGVRELPVQIIRLCRSMGISVGYCRSGAFGDGYSTIGSDGHPIIRISQDCTPERQRFTAAHELGHILLGHVGRYKLVNREPSPADNPIEQAANVFASRLLAPACVLWALNIHTPDEIAALCKISRQAAAVRAERMAVLYQRGKFLTSPIERAVYAQFRDFIKSRL